MCWASPDFCLKILLKSHPKYLVQLFLWTKTEWKSKSLIDTGSQKGQQGGCPRIYFGVERLGLICLSNRGDEHGMPVRVRGPVTCPLEWMCALAESLVQAFAGEGEVAMNDPFAGGYIWYHYELERVPWIQMEINRKLYLNEVYFDPERLRVDQRIIRELRDRIFDAIVRFSTVL